MNYLITGGCGFIGCSLIKELLKNKNNKIRILDNLSVGKKEDLEDFTKFIITSAEKCDFKSKKHQIIVGDIRNKKLCAKVTKNVDKVIHLAANTKITKSLKNPIFDFKINLAGTLNILEGCRINKVKKFVFASSAAIGGEIKPPVSEKIIPNPISPYGASKLGGEGYCSTYNKTFNIDTVILRFGNVYGPGSLKKTSVVAKFIFSLLSNKPIEIYGNGFQTRDYIYIDDIVSAIIKVLNLKNIGGEVFQIATNKETSVIELKNIIINKVKKIIKTKIKVNYSDEIKGEMLRNYSDTRKARKVLKWKPSTNLNNGINKTITYFIENLNK